MNPSSLLNLPLGISQLQELLLKAATFPKEDAVIYWEKWKKACNITQISVEDHQFLPKIFDPLDYDSQRLLPLVYKNLENLNDPIIAKLRGNYRYHWLKGNHFMGKAATLVSTLQKAGFEVMVLKGLPIASVFYKNMGARPMDDIDIFVPIHQIEEVILFLETQLSLKGNKHENELRKLGMFHAIHFTDGKGLDFDLHCHFHIYNLNAESDQIIWENKIPFALSPEVNSFMPSPTHLLYRNFTHGYSWLNPNPPIRWIPDCLAILSSHTHQIDWKELLALASKQNLIIPVCNMLHYLATNFNVKYPEHVSNQIANLNCKPSEKLYFKLLINAPKNKKRALFNVNRTARILLRYHLYQERDIRNSFPEWVFKKIKYYQISKNL